MTTTCLDCIHNTPPAILDVGHPCMNCHGSRVVLNGSNFRAKPKPPIEPFVAQDMSDVYTKDAVSLLIANPEWSIAELERQCRFRGVKCRHLQIEADPDPYENTKAHDVTELHEADNDAARYVVELETGVWYDGNADGGDPPRTLWKERASRHTHESAQACLEYCRSFRPFKSARIVRVEDEADKEER